MNRHSEMAADRNEDSVIFHRSPASLRGMALSNTALLYWRREVSNLYFDESIEKYQVFINDHTLPLPTPRYIVESINQRIGSLSKKFDDWWHYHSILHFDYYAPQSHQSLRIECLNRIICRMNSNADICYVRTAENLLNSDKLSLAQKYRLACMYRFVDHVQKLWPLVMETSRMIHPENFAEPFTWRTAAERSDQYLLLKYWSFSANFEIHYLKININVGYQALRTMYVTRLFQISNVMHPKMRVEFLSNLLNSQEIIVEVICNLLDPRTHHPNRTGRSKLEPLNLMEYLLPKLNIFHLHRVLDRFPVAIITHLARDEENYLYVLHIWSYLKDSIGEYRFFSILHKLWQMAFVTENCPYHHVSALLHEIFISAPAYLKNYVAIHQISKFFNELPDYHKDPGKSMINFGADVEFFFELLKNTEFQRRRKLWINNWFKLIFLMGASKLDELMKLCLTNEVDIATCKIEMNQIFLPPLPPLNVFIERGLCFELVDLLKLIFPSVDETMRSVREAIVTMNISLMPGLNSKAVIRFNEFIDGTYPLLESAREFKENLIMENIDLWQDWIDRGYLIGVKNTIQYLISSEQHVIELKDILYQRYQNILESGNIVENGFSIRQCEEFLRWCAPSQVEMFRFKKSLNIVGIFKGFVDELKPFKYSKYPSPAHKDVYRNFLQWFFVDENSRLNFVEMMLDNLRLDEEGFGSFLRLHFC